MRLSLPRAPRPRQLMPEQDLTDDMDVVYGCAHDGCAKLALQSCLRCGQRFCTQHIRAWERDLPARGLKLYPPDWYCYQCRTSL